MNPLHKPQIILVLILLVIVVGEGSLLFVSFTSKGGLPSPPKACFAKSNEYDKWVCFAPYFQALAKKVSAVYAMNEAKRFKNERIIDDCHLTAHYIGEASLEKENFDVGKAFSSCEFGCIEGCFHGVMERYIRYTGDPSRILAKINNVCDTVGVSESFAKASLLRNQCAHGIGHGLVAHGFLPVVDAVQACRSLEGVLYQERCLGGVAMEHVEQYLGLKENHLMEVLPEICAPFYQLPDGYPEYACLSNIGVGLMFYTKHDLQLSGRMCEVLQKPEYITVCKEGTAEEEIINIQSKTNHIRSVLVHTLSSLSIPAVPKV